MRFTIRLRQRRKKTKTEPEKRGRKPKKEREQWLKEKSEREANLPIYEKKIEDQLEVPLDELRAKVPQAPKECIDVDWLLKAFV